VDSRGYSDEQDDVTRLELVKKQSVEFPAGASRELPFSKYLTLCVCVSDAFSSLIDTVNGEWFEFLGSRHSLCWRCVRLLPFRWHDSNGVTQRTSQSRMRRNSRPNIQ
jgi:hypothetical protein